MGLLFKTTNDNNNNHPAWAKNKLPEPVYYVFCPHDGTVRVGVDVSVKKKDNHYIISWWDPTHERCMCASKIAYNSDYFAFKRCDSEGEHLYFFVPMDLEIYNFRVKKYLSGTFDFDNKEDMIRAFLDSARAGI